MTGQIALNVQVPLLDVAFRMVVEIGDGKTLHNLRGVLLSSQNAESTANGRNDAGCREGCIDGVHGNGAIDRSGIGGSGVVDQVIVGIKTE